MLKKIYNWIKSLFHKTNEIKNIKNENLITNTNNEILIRLRWTQAGNNTATCIGRLWYDSEILDEIDMNTYGGDFFNFDMASYEDISKFKIELLNLNNQNQFVVLPMDTYNANVVITGTGTKNVIIEIKNISNNTLPISIGFSTY